MIKKSSERRWPFVISQVLAVVFHPVFLPVYGLLIIFNAPTFMVHLPYSMKKVIFMLAAVNMTVVPLAMLPLLKYRNIILSYNMETTRERLIPVSLGLVMYIITTVVFFSYQIPMLIKTFMLSATIASSILLVLTFRFKVSYHSAGMGGLMGAVLALSIRMGASLSGLLMALLFISAVVMTSRLYLRAHSPAQVYTGFLVGFVPFVVVMVYFG